MYFSYGEHQWYVCWDGIWLLHLNCKSSCNGANYFSVTHYLGFLSITYTWIHIKENHAG